MVLFSKKLTIEKLSRAVLAFGIPLAFPATQFAEQPSFPRQSDSLQSDSLQWAPRPAQFSGGIQSVETRPNGRSEFSHVQQSNTPTRSNANTTGHGNSFANQTVTNQTANRPVALPPVPVRTQPAYHPDSMWQSGSTIPSSPWDQPSPTSSEPATSPDLPERRNQFIHQPVASRRFIQQPTHRNSNHSPGLPDRMEDRSTELIRMERLPSHGIPLPNEFTDSEFNDTRADLDWPEDIDHPIDRYPYPEASLDPLREAHREESIPLQEMNRKVSSQPNQQGNAPIGFVAYPIGSRGPTDPTNVSTASHVSSLLDEATDTYAFHARPLPIEPPTGWSAVEEELRSRLERCDSLLRRNAVMSAREEILIGLRVLFRAIDLRSGQWVSEPAFDQALAALTEESEFHESRRNPAFTRTTESIAANHATLALKNLDLVRLSPDLAAQHYRSYARDQFVIASDRHPWASDLLYALGKTYEKQADVNKDEAAVFRNKAVACYQAAITVSPSHADSANQLGFALIQLDRLNEAEQALALSVRIKPQSASWSNLAEVYRRSGRTTEHTHAINQAASFSSQQSNTGVPEVVQIEPAAFAATSPNSYVMHNRSSNGGQPIPVNTPTSIPQDASRTNWFGKWLR